MKLYIAYPMWSNPRYKAISILSAVATLAYALVWSFNFSGYNTSLPGLWLIVSLPLITSMFWHQALTIGDATFFYQERFFGFTILDIKSADLGKLDTRDEKALHCITFIYEGSRIVTDFYQRKNETPCLNSPFSHVGLNKQEMP